MKKMKMWLLLVYLVMSVCFMVACKDKNENAGSNIEQSGEMADNVDGKDNNEDASKNNNNNNDKEPSTDESEREGASDILESESNGEQETKEVASNTEAGGNETKKPSTVNQQTTTAKPTTTTAQQTTTSGNSTTEQTTTKAPSGNVINTGVYDVTKYSRRGMNAEVYTKAESIIKSILNTGMTEAEKVRAIHDYIVINTFYAHSIADNIGNYTGTEAGFSAYGALINKSAVCEGYSEAFLLLCWTAGIEARLVEGKSYDELGNQVGHEWNIVKIGGKWYQIDCTWDDPTIYSGGVEQPESSTGANLRYTYFLVTDADIKKDHIIEEYYNDTAKTCNSTDYYEYADNCAFQKKLGSVPYKKVTSYTEADNAASGYVNQGITKYAVVYTEGALDYNTIMNNARTIYGKYLSSGKYSVSCSVQYDRGYEITVITLTKTAS